jgi:hypothetical protein
VPFVVNECLRDAKERPFAIVIKFRLTSEWRSESSSVEADPFVRVALTVTLGWLWAAWAQSARAGANESGSLAYRRWMEQPMRIRA